MEYIASLTAMDLDTSRVVAAAVLAVASLGLAVLVRAWLANRRG